MTAVPLPVVDAGPEALFRIGRVTSDGSLVRGSMPVGSWLTGPDGRVAAGALGVLVDNVLGYAIIASSPPDHWSVSTEITLDVYDALQSPGERLLAEAWTVHTDALGGFAMGRVLTERGEPVATCTERGRFVPAPAGSLAPAGAPGDLVRDATGLGPLITARHGGDHVPVALEVTRVLQNPMRNLHGGISLAATDLAATTTLAETSGPALATASVHVVYARPVPTGTTAAFRTTLVHRGRSLAVVDVAGEVAGRPCTFARVTAQSAP